MVNDSVSSVTSSFVPLQLNGTNVNLPVTPVPSVSVFKSGKHYTVAMTFGVTVRYDGNHHMEIKVIKE